MSWFIFTSAVELDTDSFSLNISQCVQNIFQSLQQTHSVEKEDSISFKLSDMIVKENLLDQFIELWIRNLYVSSEIPAKMHHWNNTFKALQFIPFITLNSQGVLSGGERSYVPRNVITPPNSLYPMNTPENQQFG